MNNSGSCTNSDWLWIYNISELCPECASVPGGDYPAFYFAHYTALSLILISFSCCLAVICSVLKDFRHGLGSLLEGSSSPSRFPLVIAITDAIRSASHGADHFYLLYYQTCPRPWLVNVFGALESWGVGYQHSMQAGLAVGMYFKICRGTAFWGRTEWKLHAATFLSCGGIAAFSILTNAYGCSPGFWIGYRADTGFGIVYTGFVINMVATLWAITLACFIAIRRKIGAAGKLGLRSTKASSYRTATECLTTYIFVSILLYFPLAVGCWTIFVTTAFFGVVEYSTVLVIISTANSLGSANALAYLYNKRLRGRQVTQEQERQTSSQNTSSTKTSSSRQATSRRTVKA